MATLTPTLTLSDSTTFSDTINFSVTDSLTTGTPSQGLTKVTITTADTTDSTGDMFVGGILSCNAAAVNTIAQFAADKCKLTFDDNVANTGGGPGTWVEIVCVSKSNWFVNGILEGDSDADGVGSAIASDVD